MPTSACATNSHSFHAPSHCGMQIPAVPTSIRVSADKSTEEEMHIITLERHFPDGNSQKCNLKNVLYVPNFSYNLLSVSKHQKQEVCQFRQHSGCEILNGDKKVITLSSQICLLCSGSDYCLFHSPVYNSHCKRDCPNSEKVEVEPEGWKVIKF